MKILKNKYFSFALVFLLILASLTFKLLVAWLGHNPDMESWMIVSAIMQQKKVVYSSTQFYNYGPLWSYVLWVLGWAASKLDIFKIREFHLVVAFTLGVVDILISYVIYKIYGKYPAIIYLANPVTILLSGYHSQIDNIAVLFALAAWYFYLEAQKTFKNKFILTISAVLFGLSLSSKHILVFFPIWIFLLRDYKFISFWKKVSYFFFSFLIFFLGFVVEYFRAGSQQQSVITGIKANVLGYKGSYGISFVTNTIDLFFPSEYLDSFFQFVPIFKGYIFVYLLIISVFGLLYIRWKNADPKYILPMYLLVFFASSISMADQYIAIAMPAIAIFYSNVVALLFFVIVFAYLSGGASANISNLQSYATNLNLFDKILPFWPWNATKYIQGISAQTWAAMLAIYVLIKSRTLDLNSQKYFKINLYIFALCILLLSIYLFMKFTPPKNPTIEVNTASYGTNCGAKKGNATSAISEKCNGLSECSYVVSFSDPKPGCMKDFKIEWNCEPGSNIKSEYFINIGGETSGTEIKLVCPAELYSRYE